MKQKSSNQHDRLMTEYHFAEIIAKRADLYLVRTPGTYAVRYALIDRITSDIKAWLEVTCRPGNPGSEFQMSLKTWMNGIELAHQTGKPFLIGYRYEQYDYLLQIMDNDIPMVLVDDYRKSVNEDEQICRVANQKNSTGLSHGKSQKASGQSKESGSYVVRIPQKLFYVLPNH